MIVVVVAVDQAVTAEGAYVATNDQTAYAQLGAEWLFEQIGGSGKVVEMRGIDGVPADTDRHDGFLAALQNYPDIEVVAETFTGWDPSTGALGRILSICGSYTQDWLLYPTDYNWRVLSGEGGRLRAVPDIGTHWLDLVQTITGLSVETVLADLKTVHTTRQRPTGEVATFSGKVQPTEATESIAIETEDSGAALLRFSGGVQGSLCVSQVTAGRKNCLRYEIAGSEATVAWNS